MEAAFIIIVGLVLAAIFGGVWLVFLSLFIIGRRRKSQALIWLGGIPLAGSSLIAICVIGVTCYSLIYATKPANVYEMAFGFPPTPDVTNLQSSYYFFADTGMIHLRFNASPQTVDKIVEMGLKRVDQSNPDKANAEGYITSLDVPSWWQPATKTPSRVYEAENRIGEFSSESEVLCYNEEAQVVHYSFTGID